MAQAELAVGVDDGIGALLDPVSQEDDRRHVVGAVDARDVQVAVDKGLDIGVGRVVLAREIQQALGGTLGNGLQPFGSAAGAVLTRPPSGNRISPARMDGCIEPLTHLVIKAPSGEAVHGRLDAHVITVGDEDALALCLHNGVSVKHREADLVAQVVKQPHVVVAGDPGDFHARVGQLGQLAQEADVATGDDILVLIPVVKDVAQQEQLGGIGLDAVQKTAHSSFPLQIVPHVLGAQMQV